VKTLPLNGEQRAAITRFDLELQTAQLKTQVYISAILDQHNLKGNWNVVGITDKGLQVEKK